MGVRNKCVCKREKCKIDFIFLEKKTIHLAMENLKRNFQTNNLHKNICTLHFSLSFTKNFTKNRIKIRPWEDLNSYLK